MSLRTSSVFYQVDSLLGKRKSGLDLITPTEGLDAAPPHFQARLAREVAYRKLEKKPKPEFIEESTKVLMIWIHGEAVAQSSDAVLERFKRTTDDGELPTIERRNDGDGSPHFRQTEMPDES